MKRVILVVVLIALSSFVLSQPDSIDVGAVVVINPILDVQPNNISAVVLPLSTLERNLTFRQNTNFEFEVIIQANGSIATWLTFSEDNFTLTPGELRNVTVNIAVPDTTSTTHLGNIIANDVIIPVSFSVNDRYQLKSSLDVEPSRLIAGEITRITATIDKQGIGQNDPEGRIIVHAQYDISKGKNTIATFNTTNIIADAVLESFIFNVPSNASSGLYKVTVTATHADKSTTSKDNFFVGKNSRSGRLLVALFSIFG